nr:MAG TPA: hypothetical protein [Caudoviricetes sp.]
MLPRQCFLLSVTLFFLLSKLYHMLLDVVNTKINYF